LPWKSFNYSFKASKLGRILPADVANSQKITQNFLTTSGVTKKKAGIIYDTSFAILHEKNSLPVCQPNTHCIGYLIKPFFPHTFRSVAAI
jgi:hypothetical protein